MAVMIEHWTWFDLLYEQNSGELDVAEQAQRKKQDASEDAVMLEGDMSVISDNSSEP